MSQVNALSCVLSGADIRTDNVLGQELHWLTRELTMPNNLHPYL